MKKRLSLLLIFALLISLAGCSPAQGNIRFYYPRSEIQYGQADGVIASESREAPGHEEDLTYLLMLYLEGPISQELTSPFPEGTTLQQLDIQENALSIVLSDALSQLDAMDYTIACACLAQTCFGLGEFDSVTVSSTLPGSTSITLTPDSVMFSDNSVETDPT